MATFTGRYPKDTYGGLLNVDNSNNGIDATLRAIQDGLGTATPMTVSTSAVNFTNNSLQLNGTAATSGGLLKHEVGGLETNISAIVDGDFIVGTGAGTLGLERGATARTTLGLVDVAPNALFNGDFRIGQRGTSFTAATTPANNDDTWLHDRWLLLSDGNDIADVSTETTIVPTGCYSSAKFLVATANKKFGYCQILEARDSAKFIGGTASLSFQARTTTGAIIENVRAVILSWAGTADSVTSDVVSAWNAEGSNPTWASNWTAENTPANLAVTADAFATHTIENVSIDTSSAVNIAVFIWVDDTDAALNDVLYISDISLVEGPSASGMKYSSYADELARCRRYFRTIGQGIVGVLINSGNEFFFGVVFDPEMRVTPAPVLTDTTPTVHEAQGGEQTRTGSSASFRFTDRTVNGMIGQISATFGGTDLRVSALDDDIIQLDSEL